MAQCACGNTVSVGVNGYRTSDGEIVCDPCNDAAAAVTRAGR